MPKMPSYTYKVQVTFNRPVNVVINEQVYEQVIVHCHNTEYRPMWTETEPYRLEMIECESYDEIEYMAKDILSVRITPVLVPEAVKEMSNG